MSTKASKDHGLGRTKGARPKARSDRSGRSSRWARAVTAVGLFWACALGTAGLAGAGIAGAGESGIQVQSLETMHASHITAEFYDYQGRLAHQETRRDVPPGGFANFYLPGIAELQNGAYSMVLRAVRASEPQIAARVGAINRTDWPSSGGAAMYSDVQPGADVYLPLVVHQPGTQVSLISIQNTELAAAASVDVELLAAGAARPAVQLSIALPAAGATVLDLAKGADFASLPEDFVGAMRVRSDQPVAVMSLIDLESGPMAVSAFEGQPVDRAGARLYAPLFRNAFHGTTGISVANPGADAVEVRVTYRGTDQAGNACAGQTIEHAGGSPVAIPAGSSAVFYQGGATPEAGAPGLPAGCYGSAVVEVVGDGAVMATVQDFTVSADGRPNTAAAYRALPAEEGSTRVSAPLVRKAHTAFRYSTGLQVMNLGSAPASARLSVFDQNNQPIDLLGAGQATIAPEGSQTWYLPALAGIAEGMYGSAIVEADQPLALIVSEVAETGRVDLVSYNGIAAPAALASSPLSAMSSHAAQEGASAGMADAPWLAIWDRVLR